MIVLISSFSIFIDSVIVLQSLSLFAISDSCKSFGTLIDFDFFVTLLQGLSLFDISDESMSLNIFFDFDFFVCCSCLIGIVSFNGSLISNWDDIFFI